MASSKETATPAAGDWDVFSSAPDPSPRKFAVEGLQIQLHGEKVAQIAKSAGRTTFNRIREI